MKNSADRFNSRFEMAEEGITNPEDRSYPTDNSYPIQRTERRNEIEGQRLRDLRNNIKISISLIFVIGIRGEERERGVGKEATVTPNFPNLMKTSNLQIKKKFH